MARHREVRGVRRATARPRYARISAAGSALAVTLVAVLGGIGVLPRDAADPSLSARLAADAPDGGGGSSASSGVTADQQGVEARPRSDASRGERATANRPRPTLPANSGTGRRVVFAQGDQRVWLVDPRSGDDRVTRTYLVSGSVTDNLSPGTYAVYSKSMHAIGIDDSGTMEYMVRFAHGDNAAIGFHDIPIDEGHLVQTRAGLGTPRSHGCIRQWRPDARALWAFAPVGTKVVVVA